MATFRSILAGDRSKDKKIDRLQTSIQLINKEKGMLETTLKHKEKASCRVESLEKECKTLQK